MEAQSSGALDVRPVASQPQPQAAKRERGEITYAVYEAAAPDVVKDDIASQLNLIAQGIKAKTERDARWQVIDSDEALTKKIADGETLYLVAIPERRATIKHTRLDRKVAERRI